jgi:hypothetical protein
MARSFSTLRRLLLTIQLPILTVLLAGPGIAGASTKPDLIPTIHTERASPLAASGDTVCLYGGVGSEEGRFQLPPTGVIPSWQSWTSIDRTGVSVDHARLVPRFTDLDPSFEDFTPVAGFMSVPSPTWTYGDLSDYAVIDYGDTSGVWNEIWSPEIEFDLPGTFDDGLKGCLLEFLVWRHLPYENGIFYTWAVRSSANGGITWTNFRSYNEAYFGAGLGDWVRHRVEVGPLLVNNPTHVQIALGVVDLSTELGLPGDDATPSPVFDNVALCKYAVPGPVIIYRREDLFQDAFAFSGGTDVSTAMARDALDVRIDVGRDIDPGPSNDPGDSLVVKVRGLGQVGISNPSTQILLYWILDVNPLFGPALRGANPGVVIPGGAPNGWDQYTGTVGATQVTVSGSPIPDLYYFDLPDLDFMYPGDELRYYISATDDGTNTTTVPEDTSDFSSGTGDWPDEFDMDASPTYSSTTGEQPPLLLIKDGLDLAEEYEYAMKNLGLVEGVDYDAYTVNAPDACLGNGIGSSGTGGATATQLEGYKGIVYDCGDLESCLLSDGSGTDGNDDGDDIGVITAWHALSGDRIILYFGDNLASVSSADFVQYVMGVTALGRSVAPDIGGETSPSVVPELTTWDQDFAVYGGPPSLSTFDEIEPATGAVRSHVFATREGTSLGVPASVIYDRIAPSSNRNVDVTFPYGFASISEPDADGVPTSVRAELLGELLTHYDVVSPSGSPTFVASPPATPTEVTVIPNPSNPRAVVRLSLGQASEVSATIYDLRGRRVRSLFAGRLPAGVHDVVWDGHDDAGASVASGVYVVKVVSQDGELLRKIALVR